MSESTPPPLAERFTIDEQVAEQKREIGMREAMFYKAAVANQPYWRKRIEMARAILLTLEAERDRRNPRML